MSNATPVHVLVPPGLLARLESWLSMTGMRLYHAPVKDSANTFLVGVDLPEVEPQADGSWPTSTVLEAYTDAVAACAETPQPKQRARRERAGGGR